MTFNDIQDSDLQAYNRSVMFYNIMGDMSKDAAIEYASQFSAEDRLKMVEIIKEVKEHGADFVKARVIRSLSLPPEDVAYG